MNLNKFKILEKNIIKCKWNYVLTPSIEWCLAKSLISSAGYVKIILIVYGPYWKTAVPLNFPFIPTPGYP